MPEATGRADGAAPARLRRLYAPQDGWSSASSSGAFATRRRRRGSRTTTAPPSRCSRTSECRRSSPCSGSASRSAGRSRSSGSSIAELGLVAALAVRRELAASRLRPVYRRRLCEKRRRAGDTLGGGRAAGDLAGRLAALRAVHGRDLRRRSAWISTRPGRATRRGGSCRRCSTRPPATTATRSCDRVPVRAPDGVDGSRSQIVEGPIAFFALCEHHALPFHGVAHVGYVAGAGDPRDLEADPARPPLRAPVHRAGTARRADRGHARRARAPRAASRCISRRRISARRCAASPRRARGR